MKSDSDDETEAKPEETVKDAQVELKRQVKLHGCWLRNDHGCRGQRLLLPGHAQVLCSSRAVATSAFHDLAGGGQKIKVAALKDAAKHLGEFGAPVFKHIFPSKYLDNRVTLSCVPFPSCGQAESIALHCVRTKPVGFESCCVVYFARAGSGSRPVASMLANTNLW